MSFSSRLKTQHFKKSLSSARITTQLVEENLSLFFLTDKSNFREFIDKPIVWSQGSSGTQLLLVPKPFPNAMELATFPSMCICCTHSAERSWASNVAWSIITGMASHDTCDICMQCDFGLMEFPIVHASQGHFWSSIVCSYYGSYWFLPDAKSTLHNCCLQSVRSPLILNSVMYNCPTFSIYCA